jgi:hypothetical protein
LSEQRAQPPLRLWITHLRFIGQKRLRNIAAPVPINYDQTFQPGVNVIFIPDNDVGKSSILKTIKFALTGDDGDYDTDVRSWISDIWLEFSMNETSHTIVLARRNDGLRAVLVVGQETRPYEQAIDNSSRVFAASHAAEVKESLQRFFFDRLGLRRLTWAMPGKADGEDVTEAGTSWLTYFQALVIPDGGDRYLLCDREHAMGNQEGLIFSAFLGLRLAEQLNRLGTESAKIKKQDKQVIVDRVALQKHIDALDAQLTEVRKQIGKIDAAQQKRRERWDGVDYQTRIDVCQDRIRGCLAEEQLLEKERADLNDQITFARARETQLRELIALKLHFTGLDVRLCPNCDAEIGDDAIANERESHQCRLCNRPAHDAPEEEIAGRKAEAEDLSLQIVGYESRRRKVQSRLAAIRSQIAKRRDEVQDVVEVSKTTLSEVLPTQDEQSERDRLVQESGGLLGKLSAAKAKMDSYDYDEENGDKRLRIVNKARDVLRQEAENRNAAVLTKLNDLTQQITELIGAESISDVTCSALGQVKLQKHGNAVRFTGIQNQGERMRVKLAFFLAMMQLGREPCLGRHPGLLLIDQPGAAEMVSDDFRALAHFLYQLDQKLANSIQIICFTARSEFSEASQPEKVYGAQASPYAF